MAMNVKKAKLAHEKRRSSTSQDDDQRFFPSKIVGEVAWPPGKRNILVDLDGDGLMGIISPLYAIASSDGSGLVPARIACPAVYDTVKRGRAHALFLSYQKANEASQ